MRDPVLSEGYCGAEHLLPAPAGLFLMPDSGEAGALIHPFFDLAYDCRTLWSKFRLCPTCLF